MAIPGVNYFVQNQEYFHYDHEGSVGETREKCGIGKCQGLRVSSALRNMPKIFMVW
jgi:hypothetical protein